MGQFVITAITQHCCRHNAAAGPARQSQPLFYQPIVQQFNRLLLLFVWPSHCALIRPRLAGPAHPSFGLRLLRRKRLALRSGLGGSFGLRRLGILTLPEGTPASAAPGWGRRARLSRPPG